MYICKELFDKIDELTPNYTKMWVDVCNIESPTDHKPGVDAVGNYFAEKAEGLGWKVERLKQEVSGDCICITLNPESGAMPVCLSGHMDTVHPIGSFGTPAVHCEDGYIYGPGVTDCKGGLVAAFLAMEALHLIGFTERPVHLLLQSDEENSSATSNKETIKYICEKSKNAIAFLNCEGYRLGKAVLSRKGISRYKLEISGKTIHSSKCFEGASAICEAAYKIIELEKLKNETGITCNCGIIEGGTAENTVPEFCSFSADIRYTSEEEMHLADRLVRELANKSFVEGTSCNVILESRRVPMEKTEKNLKLFEEINKIYRRNKIPPLSIGSSLGGSDASDVTACGIPCVDSLGVNGNFIHSRNELGVISSLPKSAKRLAAIVFCIEDEYEKKDKA